MIEIKYNTSSQANWVSTDFIRTPSLCLDKGLAELAPSNLLFSWLGRPN